jgi:hypothetical protein
LLLAAPGHAEEVHSIVSKKEDAILEIEATEIVKGAPRIRLSDSITLKLRFVNDRTVEVRDLQLNVVPLDWHTATPVTDPPLVGGKGKLRSMVLKLDPWKIGSVKLPAVSVSYRLNEKSDWQLVRWEGQTVEVQEPESREILGDPQIEPVPPAPESSPFPIREAALVAALLLAGVCLTWWATRPRPAVQMPPDQRALRELETARSVSASKPPGWLHGRVSAILRLYLEERHGIQAPRRTTEELLLMVREAAVLSEDQLGKLGELLGSCDRVKFTGLNPEGTECEEILSGATRFVTETAPVPPT